MSVADLPGQGTRQADAARHAEATRHAPLDAHEALPDSPVRSSGRVEPVTTPRPVLTRRSRSAAIAALALIGCALGPDLPDLALLYDREAGARDIDRNPIVLIPGLLGSRLVDPASGRVVWGAFTGDYADPATPDGARLVALPMREGAALADLRDEVVPSGAVDQVVVDVLGLPLELAAYVNLLRTLGVGGYRDEALGRSGAIDYGADHYTCFQFDYDWRRDNVENAARLDRFLREKRAQVQAEHARRFGVEGAPVKFDIVAHSMGGLLLRWYLRHGAADLPADGSPPPITWAGAELVERAVLVGTPSAGSLEALLGLVQGQQFLPLTSPYPAAVVGTMPSLYQLLPRGRHGALRVAGDSAQRVVDLHDVRLWERMRWGLLDPSQDDLLRVLLPGVPSSAARRRVARDHLARCLDRARRFSEALDAPAARPAGLDLYLFAGDAVPTRSVAALDEREGALSVLETAPGDGTVTRASALMDERTGGAWAPRLVSPVPWTQVTFLSSDHFGMTRDPSFEDNLLFLLLEGPRAERRAPSVATGR